MKKLACIAFIFIFGLVACGQAPTAAQPIKPTVSASLTPTATIPATPTIAIPTSTLTPTQTIEPTLDLALLNSATEIALCGGQWFENKTSPNGQWVAGVCDDGSYNGNNNVRLHIARVDGTKAWQVSFKDLTGYGAVGYHNQFGEFVGFPSMPLPFHWYKDSRYLFIAPQVMMDYSQDAIIPDGLGLYRFDTQTGRYSPFLPSGESAYYFSFSPDDEYYVYSYGMDEKSIHIASLETGKEQAFQIPNGLVYAKRFRWSPDGTKFAFICYNAATEKRVLLLFDTTQKTSTTLLEEEQLNQLAPLAWTSNTQLTLAASIWDKPEYLLNIDTKGLQPIPTPPAP